MAAQAAILDSQMEWSQQFRISMSLWCFPSSFSSIWLTVWEEMSFEGFQDGHHGSHLGYWNRTILAILNLYVAPMSPIKFPLNLIKVWEEMPFEEFQDGRHDGHLGYRNRTILAILNLCLSNVSHQVSTKSDKGLGGDIIWRISRCPPWWLSWILKQNDFNNSESLGHTDASHQISAQSDLWFWRGCHRKNFKMAAMMAILDIGMKQF